MKEQRIKELKLNIEELEERIAPQLCAGPDLAGDCPAGEGQEPADGGDQGAEDTDA
ncbi:hypothetical protein MYX84_12090 [Acidobacteria bacterium AH-259-O06]|nr:hypothetical protein [Acidobacteria bacterium AH-259-O06]